MFYMSSLDITCYNICVKEGRDNFIQKLKQAGKVARNNILQNADEETRLRFLLEEFIKSGDIIKENNLKNEKDETTHE